MKVSLNTFLRTGNLGELRIGMSKEEVRVLLGEPDAMGGESRKYRQPKVFLYGTAELNFNLRHPRTLNSFHWEAGEKGAFRLSPACEIVEWAFAPGWTFAQIDDYLNELGLPREYPDTPWNGEDILPSMALESGVRISFEDGKLYSVWR